MTISSALGTLVALAAVIGAAPLAAQNSSPSADESSAGLEARLQKIEEEIAHRMRRPFDRWLTEERAAEVRALVADVLADADARASLQDDEAVAGHDGDAFFLQSPDEGYRLEISGQIQIRYIYNRQNHSEEDEHRGGFQVHRSRMKFDGHLFDDTVKFSLTGDFSRDTGRFGLVDATMGFDITKDLALQIGRFRTAFLREEDVSSKRQALVDRSLIGRAFRVDRAVGAELEYEWGDHVELHAGIGDASAGFADESDLWQATARIDVFLGEDWDQFDDYASWPGEEPVLLVGAGILYARDENPDPGEDEFSEFRWTVDASFERDGVSVLAAVVGSHFRLVDGDDWDSFGVVVQGGYFIAENWEIVARYEWGTAPPEPPDLSIASMGVNRYFRGHTLKLTADVGYGFHGVSDFWNSTSAGWREDEPGKDGQVLVRTQLQLLF